MGAKVRDVVRDVVAEVAPDEVLLLDQLAPLDEGRVTRLFERRVRDMESHPAPYAEPHVDPRTDSHTDLHLDSHTDPHMGSLECGHVDVTAPVTPVVWLALDEAARRTTCRAIDGRSRRRTPLLHHLFRRRRQPLPRSAPSPRPNSTPYAAWCATMPARRDSVRTRRRHSRMR